jgi:CRP-like cAMP-binding protein
MKTMFIKSKSSKKKGPSRADRSGLSAQPADGPRAGGRPQIGQGKGLGRDDTQHSGHGRGGGDDEEEDDADSGGLLASVKAFVAAVLKCNIRAFTSELAAAGNHRIAQDDDYMSQLLMDLFKEASTPEHVAPGKAFVVEGTKVDLFLIVSGTAVIRMSNPDGTYKELSQMRTAGDLIGDVSFLTGGTALASVVATPLAKGQTEPLEPTMVCKMSFSDISNLLESHPELMHKFFWAIGAIISKRLNALSHDTQKLLHPQHSRTGADGAMKLHAAAQLAKTSALALLGQFGLNAGSAYEAERMVRALILNCLEPHVYCSRSFYSPSCNVRVLPDAPCFALSASRLMRLYHQQRGQLGLRHGHGRTIVRLHHPSLHREARHAVHAQPAGDSIR